MAAAAARAQPKAAEAEQAPGVFVPPAAQVDPYARAGSGLSFWQRRKGPRRRMPASKENVVVALVPARHFNRVRGEDGAALDSFEHLASALSAVQNIYKVIGFATARSGRGMAPLALYLRARVVPPVSPLPPVPPLPLVPPLPVPPVSPLPPVSRSPLPPVPPLPPLRLRGGLELRVAPFASRASRRKERAKKSARTVTPVAGPRQGELRRVRQQDATVKSSSPMVQYLVIVQEQRELPEAAHAVASKLAALPGDGPGAHVVVVLLNDAMPLASPPARLRPNMGALWTALDHQRVSFVVNTLRIVVRATLGDDVAKLTGFDALMVVFPLKHASTAAVEEEERLLGATDPAAEDDDTKRARVESAATAPPVNVPSARLCAAQAKARRHQLNEHVDGVETFLHRAVYRTVPGPEYTSLRVRVCAGVVDAMRARGAVVRGEVLFQLAAACSPTLAASALGRGLAGVHERSPLHAIVDMGEGPSPDTTAARTAVCEALRAAGVQVIAQAPRAGPVVDGVDNFPKCYSIAVLKCTAAGPTDTAPPLELVLHFRFVQVPGAIDFGLPQSHMLVGLRDGQLVHDAHGPFGDGAVRALAQLFASAEAVVGEGRRLGAGELEPDLRYEDVYGVRGSGGLLTPQVLAADSERLGFRVTSTAKSPFAALGASLMQNGALGDLSVFVKQGDGAWEAVQTVDALAERTPSGVTCVYLTSSQLLAPDVVTVLRRLNGVVIGLGQLVLSPAETFAFLVELRACPVVLVDQRGEKKPLPYGDELDKPAVAKARIATMAASAAYWQGCAGHAAMDGVGKVLGGQAYFKAVTYTLEYTAHHATLKHAVHVRGQEKDKKGVKKASLVDYLGQVHVAVNEATCGLLRAGFDLMAHLNVFDASKASLGAILRLFLEWDDDRKARKANVKPALKAKATLKAKARLKAKRTLKNKTKPKAKLKAKAKPTLKPKPKATPKPTLKPKPKAKATPKPKPKATPTSKAKATPKRKAPAASKAKKKIKPEAEKKKKKKTMQATPAAQKALQAGRAKVLAVLRAALQNNKAVCQAMLGPHQVSAAGHSVDTLRKQGLTNAPASFLVHKDVKPVARLSLNSYVVNDVRTSLFNFYTVKRVAGELVATTNHIAKQRNVNPRLACARLAVRIRPRLVDMLRGDHRDFVDEEDEVEVHAADGVDEPDDDDAAAQGTSPAALFLQAVARHARKPGANDMDLEMYETIVNDAFDDDVVVALRRFLQSVDDLVDASVPANDAGRAMDDARARQVYFGHRALLVLSRKRTDLGLCNPEPSIAQQQSATTKALNAHYFSVCYRASVKLKTHTQVDEDDHGQEDLRRKDIALEETPAPGKMRRVAVFPGGQLSTLTTLCKTALSKAPARIKQLIDTKDRDQYISSLFGGEWNAEPAKARTPAGIFKTNGVDVVILESRASSSSRFCGSEHDKLAALFNGVEAKEGVEAQLGRTATLKQHVAGRFGRKGASVLHLTEKYIKPSRTTTLPFCTAASGVTYVPKYTHNPTLLESERWRPGCSLPTARVHLPGALHRSMEENVAPGVGACDCGLCASVGDPQGKPLSAFEDEIKSGKVAVLVVDTGRANVVAIGQLDKVETWRTEFDAFKGVYSLTASQLREASTASAAQRDRHELREKHLFPCVEAARACAFSADAVTGPALVARTLRQLQVTGMLLHAYDSRAHHKGRFAMAQRKQAFIDIEAGNICAKARGDDISKSIILLWGAAVFGQSHADVLLRALQRQPNVRVVKVQEHCTSSRCAYCYSYLSRNTYVPKPFIIRNAQGSQYQPKERGRSWCAICQRSSARDMSAAFSIGRRGLFQLVGEDDMLADASWRGEEHESAVLKRFLLGLDAEARERLPFEVPNSTEAFGKRWSVCALRNAVRMHKMRQGRRRPCVPPQQGEVRQSDAADVNTQRIVQSPRCGRL